jgi:Rab GDP dissociation inhibitor
MEKIKLYIDSYGRFGNSPFIYPIYGLAGIPEGFSRKCAVHGGTYMLNQNITECAFDEQGKVCSVKDGEKLAHAPKVIAHPKYMVNCGLESKVKVTGKVIRAICIINAPIAKTNETKSCQIIIPQRQTGRNSDIFIMLVSDIHQVCKKGFWVAVISTDVETNDPRKEIEPALAVIGKPCEMFVTVSDLYEPVQEGMPEDNIFVTKTLDATSHFESAAEDVLRIYKLITGKDLDLENLPDDPTDC